MTSFAEIIAELPNVDNPDVLERLKDFPALRSALDWSRPENWWGSGVDPKRMLNIAHEEGIPLAWVPRREIVVKLADLMDRDSRLCLLADVEEMVLEDCESLISRCVDSRLSGQLPLAQAALRAFREGHAEASMALAVSLGESLAALASTPRGTSFDSDKEREDWEKVRKRGKSATSRQVV